MCRIYFEGEEGVPSKSAPHGSSRGMEGEREDAKNKQTKMMLTRPSSCLPIVFPEESNRNIPPTLTVCSFMKT